MKCLRYITKIETIIFEAFCTLLVTYKQWISIQSKWMTLILKETFY